MRFLIIFFLLTSVCFAGEIKVKDKSGVEWTTLDKEEVIKDSKKVGEKIADKYKDYTIDKFSTNLNADGYYEKLAKPNIKEDKFLTEEESKQVKMVLWNEGLADDVNKSIKEGRKLIFKELMPAKNDYKHDFDRGTVFYTPKNRNYSYSKVIIPDGTIIKESNFTQRKPDTDSIQGENLTFIECNLVNIKWHPSWINQGTNNTQIQRTIKFQVDNGDGTTTLIVSHKVKEDKPDGSFVEVQVEEEIINNDILPNALLYYYQ